MSFFDAYKPFRNFMREFGLVEGLIDIWRYALHVDNDVELPPNFHTGRPVFRDTPDAPYPWELDILAREMALNAGKSGQHRLSRWRDMARAVNHIRRLDGASFTACEGEPDIGIELHRIAHRQFPAQIGMGVNAMMRAFKIFGEASIQAIVKREMEMTTEQFIFLGTAIAGHFLKTPVLSAETDYSVLGVSAEARDTFFQRITTTMPRLKAEMAKRQSYNNGWSYAWNPLEGTPLISFDPDAPHLVICPIPRFLQARTSGGLFYDLVKVNDFDNPFGRSFHTYIGEVIAATCPPPRFIARSEEPYYVGRNLKHGVDWVLSDNTGHLFIEAKTKRLTVNSKNLVDLEALDSDLQAMANAIVQHYQNIRDALDGKTKWEPDGLPIYPLVLTLEDWFIFTPRVEEILDGHLRRRLSQQGVPETVLADMPCIVASAHDFEIVSQVIAQAGVSPVMSYNLAPGQKNWSLLPAVQQGFPNEMLAVNWRLFGDEYMAMRPLGPPSAGPPAETADGELQRKIIPPVPHHKQRRPAG